MTSLEAIIDRQIRRWELEKSLRAEEPNEAPIPRHPLITVSRQHGSGGSVVAERVAESFNYTLLHRDLIDRICASTGTVRRIVESLDEHVKPQVTSWIESLLGLHYVDTSDYLKALLETISSIGRLGGVVVVGRGTNFILGPEQGFHVRVVAPLELRIRRLVEHSRSSAREAQREIETTDRERAEFIRHAFRRDVDDPQGYDLVINTGGLSLEAAARMVVSAAMDKFRNAELRIPAEAVAPQA